MSSAFSITKTAQQTTVALLHMYRIYTPRYSLIALMTAKTTSIKR